MEIVVQQFSIFKCFLYPTFNLIKFIENLMNNILIVLDKFSVFLNYPLKNMKNFLVKKYEFDACNKTNLNQISKDWMR